MKEFCRTISRRAVLSVMTLFCSLMVVAQNVSITPSLSNPSVEFNGELCSTIDSRITYNVTAASGYTISDAAWTIKCNGVEIGTSNQKSVVTVNVSQAGVYELLGNVTLRWVTNGVARTQQVTVAAQQIRMIEPVLTLNSNSYTVYSQQAFDIAFTNGSGIGYWDIDWSNLVENAVVTQSGELLYTSHFFNNTGSVIEYVYSPVCRFIVNGTELYSKQENIALTVYPQAGYEYTLGNVFNTAVDTTFTMGFALSGAYPDGWTYQWFRNGSPVTGVEGGNADTEDFYVSTSNVFQLPDWVSTNSGFQISTSSDAYTVNVAEGDVLSFFWNLDGGSLVVTVDGNVISNQSGIGNSYEYYTFGASGTHTIEFSYNGAGSATVSDINITHSNTRIEDWETYNFPYSVWPSLVASDTYTVYVAAGSEFSFDWAVEGGSLTVTANDDEIFRQSGTGSGRHSYTFENAGSYVIELRHNGDGNSSVSNMTLDNVNSQLEDWTSTNSGQNNSVSSNVYTFNVVPGRELSFDWSVSSESNYDWLIVTLNGTEILKKSGSNSGTYTHTFDYTGTCALEVKYTKDGSQHNGNDLGKIYNISLLDTVVVPLEDWESTNGGQNSSQSNNVYTFNVVTGSQLSFDWLVSSESSYDWLIVTLNGSQIIRKSGTDSGTYTHTFDYDGTCTLEVKYTKDGSTHRGDDLGKIFNISVSSKSDVAMSSSLGDWASADAANQTVTYASDSYSIDVAQGGEFAFDWEVNGGNLVVTLGDEEIINQTGSNSGHYSKVFENSGTHTFNVRYIQDPRNTQDGCRISNIAVNHTNLPLSGGWLSSNSENLVTSFVDTYELDVVAGGEFTFDWEVDGGNLIVTVNGAEIFNQNGTNSGSHNYTFETSGSCVIEVKHYGEGFGRIYNVSVNESKEQLPDWTSDSEDDRTFVVSDTYTINVTAGRELSFDWEVNAENGSLIVSIDGLEILNESGVNSGHHSYTFENQGTYTLEFKHNGNGTSSISNITIDNFNIQLEDWESTNGGQNNSVSSNVYTFDVVPGRELSFDWLVSSESNYDWLIVTLDGAEILKKSGSYSGTYTHTFDYTGTCTLEVKYTKDSSQHNGNDLGKIYNISVSDTRVMSLGDWESTNGGQNSSQSNNVYTFNVVTGSQLSFDWLVSSESSYDWLIVTLNGSQIIRKSGTDSGTYTHTFDYDGTCTLEVKYTKDGSTHRGDDRGKIYNITVTNVSLPVQSWSSASAGNQVDFVSKTYRLDVGDGCVLDFDWEVNGGNLIITLDGTNILNESGTRNGHINHTFDVAGTYALEVRYTGNGICRINNVLVDKYYATYVYSVVAQNTYTDGTVWETFEMDYIVNVYPQTGIVIYGDSVFNFAQTQDLTLEVGTSGGRIGGWEYQWYRNDELAATSEAPYATFQETPGEHFVENRYKVIAVNTAENGDVLAAMEKTFTANVYPEPRLEYISNQTLNYLGCDSTINIEYAKRGGYSDGWSYEWRKNGETIPAQEVEEPALPYGLKSDVVYYIQQPHHSEGKTSWAVDENGDMLSSNVELGIECDPYDIRQQFKFVSTETGNYLYHVGEEKFVNKDRTLGYTPLDTIGFECGAYENTVFFYFDDEHYVNINSLRNLVIDSWQTADGGNSCELVDVEGLSYYKVDSLNVALTETETVIEDVYELIATNTFKDGTVWFSDAITFYVNTYPQTRIEYATDSVFNYADERSITLGVNTYGGRTDGWSYSWTKNDAPLSDWRDALCNTYETPGDTLVENVYKILAVNCAANGDTLVAYERAFDVNIYPIPNFFMPETYYEPVISGLEFTRSVEFTGGNPNGWEIVWRRNGENCYLDGKEQRFIEQNPNDSGYLSVDYTVSAINRFGDDVWYEGTIVFPVRVYPEIAFEYATLPSETPYDLYNETLELGAVYAGGVPDNDNGSWVFDWTLNGRTQYNNSSIYVHDARTNTSGSIQNDDYNVVVKHKIGPNVVWEREYSYSIASYPVAVINNVTGMDTTICGGNELTFAIEAKYADAANWTYEWRRDGQLLPETTNRLTYFENNNSETRSDEHRYLVTVTNRHNGEVWEQETYTFVSTVRPKLVLPEMLAYETQLREGDFINLGVASGRGGYPQGWEYTWYRIENGSDTTMVNGQYDAALDEYTSVKSYTHNHKESRPEQYLLRVRNVDENDNTPVHYEASFLFDVEVYRCPEKPVQLVRKGTKSNIFIVDMMRSSTSGLNNGELVDNDYKFGFGYGNSEISRTDYTQRYQTYTQQQAANNPWAYTYWEYDNYVCKSDTVYLNSRAVSDEIEEDVIIVDQSGFKASLQEAKPANVRIITFNGAVVMQMSYAEQAEFDEKFDLTDLTSGFYLIEVCIGNKREVNKIFIKE